MTDVHTKKQRSYNMSKIRSSNTKPEVALRKKLKEQGYKNFIVNSKIFGKPDIVFEKDKLAIFIDGCFWHKCPKCFKKPSSNKKFWEKKISNNVKRDKEVTKKLKLSGWNIIRLWEHDVKKDINSCVKKISRELNKFNVIDLFSGAGGLSYGFSKAGMNVLLGIDHNDDAIHSFAKNHKNAKSLCADMTKVSVSEVKKLCNNKIHIIVGGPPCQGFSMAGKRKPNDPRNSLFKEFIRIVNGIKPDICVMENVRGLLSMKTEKGKSVIDIILKEFEKIGYLVEINSINTADYGIPQKRHRIFIIARKKRIKFSFPKKTHNENGIPVLGKKMKKWVPIKSIIKPIKEVDLKYFYSNKLIKGFKRRQIKNRERGMGFGWKFLDINRPSYTISARYYKDGAEALIKYSPKSIRMLTPEECASIQTFPKSFKFVGSKNSIYQQIGNAVPPKMAKKIGESILYSLEEKYNG